MSRRIIRFWWCLMVLLTITISTISATSMASSNSRKLISYFQAEAASLTESEIKLKQFLGSHHVLLGERHPSSPQNDAIKSRFCVSSIAQPIDCRVSLSPVSEGKLCIAPCGCCGSQQWVQFSVANKLRRIDPSHWKTCKTCLKPFDFSAVLDRGSVASNVVSQLLDRPRVIKGMLLISLGSACLAGRPILQRLLVSAWFWDQYSSWSHLLHAPLLLQFWGLKSAWQCLWSALTLFERSIVGKLAELESELLERHVVTQGAARASSEN